MQSSHRGLWVVSACILVVALICSFGLIRTLPKKSGPIPLASPFVMVSTKQGHGSGTHLGDGIFLTAFHVTDGAKKFTIKTNDGRTLDGELLLESPVSDVALVFVKDYAGVASAHLSCAPNYVGQTIAMTGYPEGVEFATTWGHVSAIGITGYEDVFPGGRWKELVTLDATAAHGVSGAGVINSVGQVVGILVSGIETNGRSYPYTFMVPGKAICHALARS